MAETLITVFTKDNPNRLRRTLPQYSKLDRPVVVLDDSVKLENTRRSRKLCEKHGVLYHGYTQQERLLSELSAYDLTEFVSELGTEGWTLGLTRNYALLLATAINAKTLIMVDDDIKLTGTLNIDATVDGLDLFNYAGAHIEGMPDHSVVGYFARSARLHPDCYVSGSFLGINTSAVNNYFINKYNEDWIWLLFENDGAKPPQLGSVHQLTYNPFERALEVAHKQEFGEILLNGVFEAEAELYDEQLTDKGFWDDILRVRVRELQNIGELNVPTYVQRTQDLVVESLIDTVSSADPDEFAQVFESYYSNLPEWRQLFNDVSQSEVDDGLLY